MRDRHREILRVNMWCHAVLTLSVWQQMISPVFNGAMSQSIVPAVPALTYTQAGAVAGATAAMQQIRAAQIQACRYASLRVFLTSSLPNPIFFSLSACVQKWVDDPACPLLPPCTTLCELCLP